MLPPCFALADRVFPLVRHRAARLMAEEGLTQTEIGQRLGVSQAMVSKYLRLELHAPEADDAWMVEEMAQQAASGLEADIAGTPDIGQPNPWCRTLAQTAGPAQSQRRALVEETARILGQMDGQPLGPLIPAVNMNIAGALEAAAHRDDIAAFAGRLAFVRGRLRAHGPPEFGASQHLSAVLLQARRTNPTVRFVVNVRGDDRVQRMLHKAHEEAVDADTDNRNDLGVPTFDLSGGARVVRDPGGFGIEPAIYLFDADPESIAKRVAKLARALA